MARLQDFAKGRKDQLQFSINDLHVKDGWNIRIRDEEYHAKLHELAQSIASEGVLEPLTIYMENGAAYIENGHRRLEATKIANAEYGASIELLPCQVGVKFANEADRQLSMYTRNNGERLRQTELAELFRRLVAYGMAQKTIAQRTGMSESAVSQILAILTLPPDVQAHISSGEIAPSVAVAIQRSEGASAPAAIAAAVTVAKAAGKTKVSASDVRKATVVDDTKRRAKLLERAKEAVDSLDDDQLPEFKLWMLQRLD